jgi:DNA-binding transcriptional LysR family regulator
MINVPTDLLRTFIALADLRSFTRAAENLGLTQPAVSAQIKRLQMLLGGELLDKSAPGVTLTPKGEVVVSYARRLLSLNDQMLDMTIRSRSASCLRIGLAVDYFEGAVLGALAEFRARHPDLRMTIFAAPSEPLLRDLRRGEFDLAVAALEAEQIAGVSRSWLEPSAWCAASPEVAARKGPIPLVVLGESSLSRRLSVAALERAGCEYQIAYVGGSFAGLVRATAAGLGIACWARRCLVDSGLHVFDRTPRLPKVADVYGAVHVREGLGSELNALADKIAAAVCGTGAEASVEIPRKAAVAN